MSPTSDISFGETLSEFLVFEEAAAALGVMDDGDLEVWALWGLLLDEISDVGDILDHGRRYPTAYSATDDRVGELQAQEFKGVNPRVDARDYVQTFIGEKGQARHVAPISLGGECRIAGE